MSSVFHRIPYPTTPPGKEDVVSGAANGYVITTGVEVYTGDPSRLDITPVTSTGRLARKTFLGLPKDKTTLKQLAQFLDSYADTL